MKRGPSIAIALVALIGFVFLFQTFDLKVSIGDSRAVAETDRVFWKEGKAGPASGRPDSFADLAEALSPAVVNIKTERLGKGPLGSPEDLLEEFFGRPGPSPRPQRPRRSQSTGSGFVIAEEGYVVTNHHVVDGVDKINVVFEDGEELEATVVGLDSKTDLALLKLKLEDGKTVAAAALGDSDVLRVGDWVMAIGNPFGLDHTVTVGILSARGRNINAGPYDDFLQTDASINPGNSGGPLIDMNGRVIGINTAINAAGQGIGFAIPINMAKSLLPQLLATGTVTRGWLGVQIQRVTPALAESFELDTPGGALVSQVFENSPAEKAKVKRGDIIVEFGGGPIDKYDDLPRRVASISPGTEVDLVVIRDGKRKTLKTVLDEMEQSDEIQLSSHEEHSSGLGLEVRALDKATSEQLGLDDDVKGVVIQSIDPDGPSADSGLRRGDVIVEANRESVSSAKDLEKAISKNEKQAVLLIQRGDSTHYTVIERGS